MISSGSRDTHFVVDKTGVCVSSYTDFSTIIRYPSRTSRFGTDAVLLREANSVVNVVEKTGTSYIYIFIYYDMCYLCVICVPSHETVRFTDRILYANLVIVR